MQAQRLTVTNFRGIQTGALRFKGNSLLVGANSVGKSTICEALDLVLGPERMLRRPVLDEYDFYAARYQPDELGALPEIRLEVVLTGLSPEAERRFGGRLRRWSLEDYEYLDLEDGAVDATEQGEWCLPVVFLGRYEPAEDDFVGGTYFAHPEVVPDDLGDEAPALGAGLKSFTREDKRYCGFLYLRPNRTGNRALSFQRGSLVDTIVRLESELAGPLWENVLADLGAVPIATEESGFSKIRRELRDRVGSFCL
jgi:putative ATP-dependent endonuclease of OLD family